MTTEEITIQLSDTLHTVIYQSNITIGRNGLINIRCCTSSINGVINDLSKSNVLLIDSIFTGYIFCYISLVDLTNLKNISI